MGWLIDSDGLRYTLNKLSSCYPYVSLMIVENGFGAIDTVEEACKDGANLIGYTTWGPIDIVSTGTGNFYRKTKDSFYWYKKCIESNGEDIA